MRRHHQRTLAMIKQYAATKPVWWNQTVTHPTWPALKPKVIEMHERMQSVLTYPVPVIHDPEPDVYTATMLRTHYGSFLRGQPVPISNFTKVI